MPMLVIAGITVNMASFRRRQPLVRGESVRAFDNTLLDGTDGYKENFEGTTIPMAPADAVTLRTAIRAGAVTCSGDLIGASMTCKVVDTGTEASRDGDAAHEEAISLTIEQV